MRVTLLAKVLAKAAAVAPLALVSGHEPAASVATISAIRIGPGVFAYRSAGDYTRDGAPVDAPRRLIRFDRPFFIMKNEVSETLYDRCVAAAQCAARARGEPARTDLPAVGVSWRDATAFAQFLSHETGETWRLPSDAEWAFAAGGRFKDDAVFAPVKGDFARRWIARYELETETAQSLPARPQPFGAFGANERGLEDLSGNVWEWTSTCFERHTLDNGEKSVGAPFLNCGVRVVEGAHRAYVSDFIRDARAGGCSAGAPPTNLGFRLVREERGWTVMSRDLFGIDRKHEAATS